MIVRMTLTLEQITVVRDFQLRAVAAIEAEAAAYYEAASKERGAVAGVLRGKAIALGGAAVIVSALPPAREDDGE